MENTMDYESKLKKIESDARRLRSEYVHDALIRAAVALDFAVRGAARQVLGLFQARVAPLLAALRHGTSMNARATGPCDRHHSLGAL
jgi:hypothetical protein